jgi:hypothetical protein
MSQNFHTTLIGEDTDLLILLLYFANVNAHPLCFQSDKSKNAKVFNVIEMKMALGDEVCHCLLALQAFSG